MVKLVPVPAIAPGLTVHFPVAGNPFNTTVPVGVEHEAGCVIDPTTGAEGATGGAVIITSADACDIQPGAPVTLKLYLPGRRFEMVVLVPDPVIPPGLIVQVPVSGNPFRTTPPVVAEHDAGCVMIPITGSVGADGAGLIITFADALEIHPKSL
jgi:hypothetical protein